MTIVQCGVTAAVQAKELVDLDQVAMTRYMRELAAQLLPKLEEHVGGARPQAAPSVNVAGPEDDPFQGMIYAVSLAAPFHLEELPTHSSAYQAHNKEGQTNGN